MSYMLFRDEELLIYLESIKNCKILTREEEIELSIKKNNGDEVAHRLLVESCLKFVVSMAKQHVNSKHKDIMDLIQAGNIGLMRAVDKFDHSFGFRLTSYSSWWIKQKIVIETLSGDTIRLSPALSMEVKRVLRWTNDVKTSEGLVLPNIEFYIEEYVKRYSTNYSKDTILKATLVFTSHTMSLNQSMGQDDDDSDFDNVVADSNRFNFEKSTENSLILDQLNLIMEDVLTKREIRIMSMLYGINGFDGVMTLEEVGINEGLTRERIRQIQEKALRKIRMNRDTRELV